MKKLFLAFVGLAFSFNIFASDSASFDIQGQPLNSVVSLFYKEVFKRPYAVCDALLQDARLVSIRASGKSLDAAILSALLDSNGYEAREVSGVTVICTKQKVADTAGYEPMFYRPMYRDTAYLVELLSPLVHGVFANKRSSTLSLTVGGDKVNSSTPSTMQANSASVSPVVSSSVPSLRSTVGDDYLLFSGSKPEQDKLRKLLAQVDEPTGEVVIKGYVYEVGTNNSQASAIGMLTSLLGGKFQVNVGGTTLANSLRIKTGNIDLVASAINSDGRFKVVTSPYTRVRSGGTARFQVGADVPVLGSIVTNSNGQAQQSVEYRSAGTLFEVSPKVRSKIIEVDLFQQISSFVATETGVNNSPTLNKRELRTSLTVEDGELLVVGGLNDSKSDETHSGLWFLPFSLSQSSGNRSSEIILVLEIKKI